MYQPRFMNVDFSKMTQEVLTAYGYSEKQLAALIDVSQPTVHRIKTGAVKNPGATTGLALFDLHRNRPTEAA